jgi:hypothetical protein
LKKIIIKEKKEKGIPIPFLNSSFAQKPQPSRQKTVRLKKRPSIIPLSLCFSTQQLYSHQSLFVSQPNFVVGYIVCASFYLFFICAIFYDVAYGMNLDVANQVPLDIRGDCVGADQQ